MTFNFANAGALSLNIPIQVPEQRSTDRPTVEILPPHPTPIWEEGLHGEAGEAGAAAETGEAGGAAETTSESGALTADGSAARLSAIRPGQRPLPHVCRTPGLWFAT